MFKQVQQRVMKDVQTLKEQSEAVSAVAVEVADPVVKNKMHSAADTLESLAKSKARQLASPVRTLPEDATADEVRTARQRSAVRRGQDVFLPSCDVLYIGLPNRLLRSALFAASSQSGGFLTNGEISSQRDTTLTFTGKTLCGYDRKVFAVCLHHYRDRPLSPGGTSLEWVRTSYYQFVQALDLSYSENVHRAIRESLLRLNAAGLRVKFKGLNISLPHLVEVAFDEPEGSIDVETSRDKLMASDSIVFRVLEPVANLFGSTDWSAVPKKALTDYSGLASWLVAFYSTHREPKALTVSELHRRSGVGCAVTEFRRMLRKAFSKLQDVSTPLSLRIDCFRMSKNEVWVRLARWNSKEACPLDLEEDI